MPAVKNISMPKRSKKIQRKRRRASCDDSDEYERAADVSLTSSSQEEDMIPENTEEIPFAENDSRIGQDQQFVDQKQGHEELVHKDICTEKPRLLEAMHNGAEENTEIGSHQTLSQLIKLGREEESKDDATTKKSKNDISFYQRPKYIDTISPASQKQSL